jgi:rhodanese-related sulfurtransferase
MGDDSGWVAKVLGSELFARIPPTNIQQLFNSLHALDAKVDEVIIKQGDVGDYYYIVRNGKCVVTRYAQEGSLPVLLATLESGDSFGEEALVAAAKRNATVTMVTHGSLLRLTKEEFQQLINEPVLSRVGSAEARQTVALGGCWIDVGVAEEHERNGIEFSLSIPLDELRSATAYLDPKTSYVVYSDTGRRSMVGAFILAERGFSSHVLDGGLMDKPSLCGPSCSTVPSPEPPRATPPVTDPRQLSKEIEAANNDGENALQDKLDATTARRMCATEFDGEPEEQSKKQLASRQKRLELKSATATAALAQAQRRKLEAESKMRSAEALAERRRAEAEVECENLRRSAKQRLQMEEKRLQDQYAIAANKLEELKRIREETEMHLQRERKRIEKELVASAQTLHFEAEKIKSPLERVRRDSEEKAGQIRDDEANEEHRVRTETESVLKEERQRLEAEFAGSVSSLEKAQHKLNEARRAKSETDTESQRIVAAMRLAEEKRRADAQARRDSQRAQLETQSKQAETALQEAEDLKKTAERKRRTAVQKLARIRSASGVELDNDEQAENLEAEIQRISKNVSYALGEVDEAQRAKDDADAIKLTTEENTAHQRETEEELRLKLHDEAEEWLERERAHSAAELERAKQELSE